MLFRSELTPAGSTQAQFQNSSNNLPQRMVQQPNMVAQQMGNGRAEEEAQPQGFQKFLKTICCS